MGGRTIHLGADERPLEGGWSMLLTEASRHATPLDVHRPAARLAARVPGTVAATLADAGLFDLENPQPLIDKDAWYFRSLEGEATGSAILRFEGLATIAEVYLNGELMLSSFSMYHAHDLPVLLSGRDELAICFRALRPHLERKGPRARWRPQMIDQQGLRLVRSTLLGHMPGWCPSIHAAGPWRPISLIRPAQHALSSLRLQADLQPDGAGRLDLRLDLSGGGETIELTCGGETVPLSPSDDGSWRGELIIPAVEAWWPHTHGKPRLYQADLVIDGHRHALGLVGFRRIELDRGVDGRDFALRVNGETVFCRGAVWTSADIINLSGSAEAYAPWLSQAAEAGMNMIRIGGTMAYESAEFFRLCDQLGLMVWQDFMFANFDYPATDPDFLASVEREITDLLSSIPCSPSLAVLCGGSEIYQQGAMLGLPERIWKGSLCEQILREAAARLRPDVPYVENSPSGGAMPFSPNEGVTHYYGVGAYCRPLEDARRAHVRFAAECLAFAHVPQQATLDAHLPVPPVHDPRWKARVPRDRGASWDFEDVRDHYLQLLYGFDPARLRREEPDRYLNFSRAVTGEIMVETYAEWRRPTSSCNGALVWTLQDLLPGAGWGLIDATGEPKPVWHALRRAFRPVQVNFTDEGTNGLYVHVINETRKELELDLAVACLRDGRQKVVSGERPLKLDAGQSLSFPVTDLFGAFFDTTYAFRFGPPGHDVTIAILTEKATGSTIADACHFPTGRATALFDCEITAGVVEMEGQWFLELATDRFAQSLHVAVDGFHVADDWFHLAPGVTRRIGLRPRDGGLSAAAPRGEIRHLGSRRRFQF